MVLEQTGAKSTFSLGGVGEGSTEELTFELTFRSQASAKEEKRVPPWQRAQWGNGKFHTSRARQIDKLQRWSEARVAGASVLVRTL